MEYFFIIVSKKVETIDKNKNELDAALQRYNKYVGDNSLRSFKTFGWKVEEKPSKILINLYKYLEKNDCDNYTVLRICFGKDNLDDELYKKNEIDSKYFMDLLNNNSINNLYKKGNEGNKEIKKWQIENLIEYCFFRNIVNPFMHGESSDLVNSPLGVLKIWCDNSDNEEVFLEKTFLDENIDIQEAEKLLKKLEKELSKENSIPEFLKREITKGQYLIDSILKITKDDIKNNPEMKKSLSNNIFQLFQFVSKYHKPIE